MRKFALNCFFLSTYFLSISLLFSITSASYAESPSPLDIGNAKIRHDVAYFENNQAILNAKRRNVEAYENHQNNLMKIVERAYHTQQWMTVGIFFIVSILVLGGFYVAFQQFKAGVKVKPHGDKQEGANPTTFKFGATGIEFSSSVIGLVILFMSFMFFYLYVKDVYSIKVNYASPVLQANLGKE